MFRNILAILIGLVAGGVLNMAIVSASHAVYPLPDDVDPNNLKEFQAHIEAHGLPTGALLMVLAAHAGGSFASGFVCGLIARRPWYAAAIGLGILWTCGGVAALMMLPSPLWFAIADLVLYIPAAVLGVRWGAALRGQTSNPLATQAKP